jgi:thioredoxin-related protein
MYEQPPVSLLSCKLACATLLLLLASAAAPAQKKHRTVAPAQYVPVTEYDPKRDAAQDLQNAIKEAERTHKHILLEVGGEWCSWCHTLDKFFQANVGLLELREKNFVTVKINFSEQNKNTEVLSRYPPINGYPHIFFLDSHGKLLQSQDTGLLESGKSYNLERLTTVLNKWGPSQ